MKKPLIVIVGPTAVGKTDISISVAQRINAEIISADSMQVYKYMDIGTAKPSKLEMQGIPHYLIDEVEPDQEFNVALFQKKTFKYIDQILEQSKLPLVVGGTGLYVNSLVYPLNFTESISNWEFRTEIEKLAREKGNQYIHDLLKQVDPLSAESIHPNNIKRIVRALEVYETTGQTMTYYKEKTLEEDIPFSPLMIGLTMDRPTLYQRINHRVDLMVEKGLIDEVNGLLQKGYDKNLVSMQGLGYKEIIGFLEGQNSLEESISTLKRDTRRFAKRQLTWFRRDQRIHWIHIDEYSSKDDIINDIIMRIEAKFP